MRFWEAATFHEWACDAIVDCGGRILAPGYIDIQINGAYGIDFSDPNVTEDGIAAAAAQMLATGVTAFCPTLVSSSAETYAKVIATVRSSLCSRWA